MVPEVAHMYIPPCFGNGSSLPLPVWSHRQPPDSYTTPSLASAGWQLTHTRLIVVPGSLTTEVSITPKLCQWESFTKFFNWNWGRKVASLCWGAVSYEVSALSSHASCLMEEASLQRGRRKLTTRGAKAGGSES